MLKRPWIAVALSATLLLAGCGMPGAAPLSGQSRGTEFEALQLTPQDEPTEEFTVPRRAMAAPQPWVGNSSAKLSIDSAENLASIKDVIRRAEKTLFIEVFNFGNDSMGQQITPLVIDAAKRGVQVKFLADYVGTKFSGGATLGKQMAEAGVEFRMWAPRFIRQDNKRRGINITHRKLYLADGDRGVTGGVNLKAAFDTTTHDLLIDFRGEQAAQLHAEFNRDWVMAKGKPVEYDPLKSNFSYGTIRSQTLVTSPPEGRFEAKQAIYQAIELAQREIIIENQYLWDVGLTDRIQAAARRGVSVRVIVPGKSDNVLFKNLHAVALNAILKAGGQAKLYNGVPDTAHVHTKYFSVDDRWAVIGSVNGDTRALIDNQELDVALTDPSLLRELKTRLFEKDWQKSSVVYEFQESPFYSAPFLKLWQILDYYM